MKTLQEIDFMTKKGLALRGCYRLEPRDQVWVVRASRFVLVAYKELKGLGFTVFGVQDLGCRLLWRGADLRNPVAAFGRLAPRFQA